jgi:hypothetical protein
MIEGVNLQTVPYSIDIIDYSKAMSRTNNTPAGWLQQQDPLDLMGHPHSESLRTVERFRRRDFGHPDYEITFDDPKMYTKLFSVRVPHELLADADVFENYGENEKDLKHLGGK